MTRKKEKHTQQEISVGWVSGKTEEVFFMTRNKKKTKAPDATVNGDKRV